MKEVNNKEMNSEEMNNINGGTDENKNLAKYPPNLSGIKLGHSGLGRMTIVSKYAVQPPHKRKPINKIEKKDAIDIDQINNEEKWKERIRDG